MSDETVTLDIRDRVAIIEMNRPRVRNAMREDDWLRLRAALDETDRRDEVRAVVLSGSGGFFSAGFDIKYDRPGPPDRSLPVVHAAMMSVLHARKPIIAAVEGGAVGAGWALALACDMVVAADDAFFAPPFVERGLVPDVALGWFLARSVGFHRASQLILLSGRLTATEAVQLGLVQEVASTPQVRDVAMGLAERLAALPPRTARVARLMLRRAVASSLETMLMHEWADVSFNEADEGTRAARQRFLRKLGAREGAGGTATAVAAES
jgi:2-(1,2-epoxy-1,2-dihydrophenyl)acetyl-CoA isomerase